MRPDTNNALETALASGDIEYLRGFINGRLGIEVEEKDAAAWIAKANDSFCARIRGWWSEGT